MPYQSPRLTAPRLAPWPKDIPFLVRGYAFVEALLTLLWLDVLGLLGFRKAHAVVAGRPVSSPDVSYDALHLVRIAVRDATVFYFKPVHCLQRSATVTRMLRSRGLAASLVIGYLPAPIRGHAWVELNKQIVWDNYSSVGYAHVLDRI
jgi:Transglutaminase-like superfamily